MAGRRVIEIVGFLPNVYGICWSCMPAVLASKAKLVTDEFKDVPEHLKREYLKISEIAKWVNEEFPGLFLFRLIDSSSMLGLYKSLKHRIKKTPCILLNGEKIFEGFPERKELIEKLRSIVSH